MPELIKQQIPHRGPSSSAQLNSLNEGAAEILNELRDRQNEQEGVLNRRRLDDALGRGAGAAARAAIMRQRLLSEAYGLNGALADGTALNRHFDFYDTDHLHYVVDQGGGVFEGYELQRRLRHDPYFGQVTPPFNGAKSLFWSPVGQDGESIFLPDSSVEVTDESEETAEDVSKSDPRNAIDGSSYDPFIIRAAYPLESDIVEARFDVNFVVPRDLVGSANMLSIEPAPEAKCSIVGVKYSDTAQVATTDIPGLPTIDLNNPLYDAAPQRFIFPSVTFASVKVQLSSRHFVIEKGRKVFYLGFRELGLFQVDFDPTWSNTGAGVFTNNGMLLKFALPIVEGISPDTVYLDEIVGLLTSKPLSTAVLAGAVGTDKGVRIQVYTDDALTTRIYDSLTDGAVSVGSPITVPGSLTHVWIAIELDRNNGTGIVPVLTGLGLTYTVK